MAAIAIASGTASGEADTSSVFWSGATAQSTAAPDPGQITVAKAVASARGMLPRGTYPFGDFCSGEVFRASRAGAVNCAFASQNARQRLPEVPTASGPPPTRGLRTTRDIEALPTGPEAGTADAKDRFQRAWSWRLSTRRPRRIEMEQRCECGRPIAHPHGELGCIECGRACCRACGVALESALYCAPCAGVLMDVAVIA